LQNWVICSLQSLHQWVIVALAIAISDWGQFNYAITKLPDYPII